MATGMEDADGFRRSLLAWFETHRRDLPWRATDDPYAILVSEVLLQQTRIAAGAEYYRRFLGRFPTVERLAAATEEEVLQVWEGLGYYRRARHLHETARRVVREHNGEIPRDPDVLEQLPGIGPYTAGAVASIAHEVPVPAVDGNVLRVLSRLYAIEEDISRSATRRRIRELAEKLVPETDPGTFNQALMELGSLVCVPQTPRCGVCPVAGSCRARAEDKAERLPIRRKRTEPPEVPAAFALLERGDAVLLVQRPPDALLGGLWALPGGEVGSDATPAEGLVDLLRNRHGLSIEAGAIAARHVHAFSHKRWRATAIRCRLPSDTEGPPEGRWVSREELEDLPLVPFHRAWLREAQRTLSGFPSS